MPKVAGVEYPYTPEGLQAAANAQAQLERAARAPVTLEAEPRARYGDIMMEAARAGALGGAVGGAGVRGGTVDDAIRVRGAPSHLSAQADDAALVALSRPGHAYRGMTDAEYRATVGAGRGVRSRGDWSLANEGTSFSDDIRIAEDYANFGRTDPRKTGEPTWLVEVESSPLRRDSDGYLKAAGELPPTRVWPMEARGEGVVLLPSGAAARGVPLRLSRRGLSRLGSALKAGAKGALNPVSNLTDAAIGSLAGAGSAAAGYRSAAPRSAGRFTPPGPGYEGVTSQAEIERIAEQREMQRQRQVVELLDEVAARYGAEVAAQLVEDAGGRSALRPRHFADTLGPVRP